MTLPLNGALGLGDINEELDLSVADELGLGEALARSLAATSISPPVSSEQNSVIGVGNFYGAVNGIVIGYLIVGGGGGSTNGGGGGGGVLSGISVLKPDTSYPIVVGNGAVAGRNTGGRSSIGFGGQVPIPPVELTYLVVGGGGGGGADTYWGTQSGGGGAGGVLTGNLTIQYGAEYTIIVGTGGRGGSTSSGQPGTDSSFGSIVAKGGGYGVGRGDGTGGSGGSGGAGIVGYPGGQGTPGQGYPGGSGNGGAGGGGGGGGAGAAGDTINGGNGRLISIGGTTSYYGGGGGGRSGVAPAYTVGTGGLGGGGGFGVAGTPNTGGGGGGGGGEGGHSGGSGVVIVSYISTTPLLEGGQITVNVVGADTYQVHTFTTTGTLRFNTAPSVNTITALGGGGGGGGDATGSGLNGGSGGGGGAGSTSSTPSSGLGGSGTTGQGFAGGSGYYTGVPFAMGGGGGASAAGQDGQTSDSNGGDGVSSSITGTAVVYGGGGGGYRRGTFANLSKGLGGTGGGGDGTVENPVGSILRAATPGTNGLGGGAGGGSTNGGDGTVIVSYVALIPQMTGGTITSYVNGGGNTVQVHTFTSSGILTYPLSSITWATPEGSLETIPQGANVTTISLGATSSTGNPVTYTLNGSLPSGLSFNTSTGTISGKTNNNVARTIWNFSVTATDSVKPDVTSTRAFSYSISNPIYTTALITNAGYQGGCTSINNRVTELQSVCANQSSCSFNPLSYGDPFVGTVKQFVVTMSCTNGTGSYTNTCLGGGSEAGRQSWTFTCTPL